MVNLGMNSARIQEIITDLLSKKQFCSVQEMKDYIKEYGDYTEGQFSGSINTMLRNNTIKKIDRGVYAMKKSKEDMKKCFVISPIGEEGSETRKRADQLYKYIIKPVCEKCEFDPIRVDQINDTDSITQTILDHLNTAELVIADISEHNPNAFYEMGYRKSLSKPIIHLKQQGEKIPFDIASIRTFDYDLSDLDSVDTVKERLVKTIQNLNFVTEDTADEETNNDIGNKNILSILYEILNKLDDLGNQIKTDNSETIQTIIKTYADVMPAQKQESSDDLMTRMIMEQLIKNPSSADSLIALADKFNNLK